MIFLIATQNKHKKVEFERILAPLGIEIKTAGELGLQYPDVEETGTTFEENALLKARAGCLLAGVPTLADDSGLCVDALDGAPGLYSARWSGDGETNGDDEANNDKLLRLLDESGVPDEQRTAHYVAAVAAVFPDGREFVTRGECYGRIAHERHGSGGFGYDPLFLVSTAGTESNEQAAQGEFNQTFGEVPPAVKDSQSHRSRGLQNMYDILKREL
ncbi:MAG: non-canonical purine NTP pyrophosphatase [Ruminococcus sp.]|nr:non-canonical purine NTP pyrophosphatase [Clostridia bacterium]MBQ5630128.1 non-canonical purine NTP pyrophosphatase [Ruminococcus sp.]MEE1292717.1 non-canonical purine NTP pyrophosphatase [Acutalibacteraceae bacterium]NLD30628.1 non-canonical purine NTP pyrophosphatase [Clostridiales bacterium]